MTSRSSTLRLHGRSFIWRVCLSANFSCESMKHIILNKCWYYHLKLWSILIGSLMLPYIWSTIFSLPETISVQTQCTYPTTITVCSVIRNNEDYMQTTINNRSDWIIYYAKTLLCLIFPIHYIPIIRTIIAQILIQKCNSGRIQG